MEEKDDAAEEAAAPGSRRLPLLLEGELSDLEESLLWISICIVVAGALIGALCGWVGWLLSTYIHTLVNTPPWPVTRTPNFTHLPTTQAWPEGRTCWLCCWGPPRCSSSSRPGVT